MFTHFFFFIVALLVYATYQPTADPKLSLAEALMLGFFLVCSFAIFNGAVFRRFRTGSEQIGYAQADHRFQRLLTRQCIIAMIIFAVDVYSLNLPSYLHQFPVFQTLPTLLALLFIAFFLLHLVIVWWFAYPVYQPLFDSQYTRLEYVNSQLLLALPVLLPWFMLSGCLDAIRLLPFSNLQQLLATPEGEIAYFFIFLVIVAILGPFWLQKIWRCYPMEPGFNRSLIANVCRKAGVGYSNILYWPLFEGRMITAGVMGLIRRFRYILISPALMTHLHDHEIEAVIAHEIGHVRKGHLYYYLFFFIGYMLFAYAALDLMIFGLMYMAPMLDWFSDEGASMPTSLSLLLSLFFIGLFWCYFRYIFGYFMRHFERQADAYVFSVFDTARGLVTTLLKIARTSGQPPDRPNWHHFSIIERINFLEHCETDRGVIKQHEQQLKRRLTLFAVSLVFVGFLGYQLNFGDSGAHLNQMVIERYLLGKIDKEPQNAQLWRFLGDIYYHNNAFGKAQQAYEHAYEINAADTELLNNLAWLYVTTTDPLIANPQRGLALAQKAAELQTSSHILDTLAESYYANGLAAEAIKTARQALAQASTNRDYYMSQLDKFKRSDVSKP
jgi:Zn-dependent protease with chaperone function